MRNVKQILAFVVMAFAVLFAQAKDVIGNQELKKESRSVAPFEQIVVSADFNVIIEYAITPKVEVEAESNLHEFILTEVKGKTMNISVEKKTKIVNNFPIVIRLALPMFTKVQYTGDGEISADGIPSDKMEMTLEGNGTLNIKNLKTSSLKVTASKGFKINFSDMIAASLNLSLKDNVVCNISKLTEVKKTEITFASTEACTFAGVRSETVTIKGNGSGSLTFNGYAGKTVTATLTNSGSVKFTGSADNVTVTSSGSSAFDATGMKAEKAKVENNGSGDISVAPAASLDANITSSGSIIYLGTPKIKIENTGTGQLVKKN